RAQLALRATRRARISAARSSSAVFKSRSRSAAAGGRDRSTERRSVRGARTVTPTPRPNPTGSQNSRLITSTVPPAPVGFGIRALDVVLPARPAPLEQLAELGLATLGARPVVDAGLDLGRPVLLRHPSCRRVVRVHVPLPVAELGGARVTGVPEVLRHGAGGTVADIGHGGADPRAHRVPLGRQRQGAA